MNKYCKCCHLLIIRNGDEYYHADLIREQVVDLFVIHPDGSTVELRQ